MQETQVQSQGQEDPLEKEMAILHGLETNLAASLQTPQPLEKEMAIHFNIFAWEIPSMKSLVCYSPWSWKELHIT